MGHMRILAAAFLVATASIASAKDDPSLTFHLIAMTCPGPSNGGMVADFRNHQGMNMRLIVNFNESQPVTVTILGAGSDARNWKLVATLPYGSSDPKASKAVRLARSFYEPPFNAMCLGNGDARQRYLDQITENLAKLPRPTN
jgi:hypothetical protein